MGLFLIKLLVTPTVYALFYGLENHLLGQFPIFLIVKKANASSDVLKLLEIRILILLNGFYCGHSFYLKLKV